MKQLPFCLLMVIFSGCAVPKEKPRLGVLPVFDQPLCTERQRAAVCEDECVRRLTAFAGRGMQATVVVRARDAAAPQGTADRIGAGVVIDASGRIFTAYHVVRDMTAISATPRRVGGAGGKLVYGETAAVPMRVVSFAERLDLALLEPAGPGWLPEPITVDRTVHAFAANQKLWVFGSRAVSYGGYVSTGETVEARSPDGRRLPDLIKVGVPAVERDLGGPVIAANGDVVGIMLAADEGAGSVYFMPVSIPVQLFGLTWITEVSP